MKGQLGLHFEPEKYHPESGYAITHDYWNNVAHLYGSDRRVDFLIEVLYHQLGEREHENWPCKDLTILKTEFIFMVRVSFERIGRLSC